MGNTHFGLSSCECMHEYPRPIHRSESSEILGGLRAMNGSWVFMPQSHLLYGGRTVVVELQNRVIPAVAVEILRWPPYGEFLCFTGRRGGRRIIARSYNFFFYFYVRRRNLSHRSRAVDASTATVRRTYGGRTEALRQSVWPHGRRMATVQSPCGCLNICHKTTAAARTPCGDRASSPQRT